MVKFVSPEEATELKRLWEEYPRAHAAALRAFMTKGEPLKGAALRRFLEAEAKVAKIVQQIRDIQGEYSRRITMAPKRPRDLNEWAKRMVDIATGNIEEGTITPKQSRAREGGVKGGPARAQSLTPKQRSEIAQAAAHARWKKS